MPNLLQTLPLRDAVADINRLPPEWAFVSKDQPLSMDSILTFCAVPFRRRSNEEEAQFAAHLQEHGLVEFLDRDLMEDVVAHLRHGRTTYEEKDLFEALVHYWVKDAFVGVEDLRKPSHVWLTSGGRFWPFPKARSNV